MLALGPRFPVRRQTGQLMFYQEIPFNSKFENLWKMRINVPLLETIFMLSEFFRHGTIAASASNPSNLPMKAKTKTAASSVSSPSPTVRGWFFNCPLGRDSLHTNSSKGFNLGLFLDLRG